MSKKLPDHVPDTQENQILYNFYGGLYMKDPDTLVIPNFVSRCRSLEMTFEDGRKEVIYFDGTESGSKKT